MLEPGSLVMPLDPPQSDPSQSDAGLFDILIVGGGPVGLAFARSLAGTGLRLAVVERQDEASLAEPPADGREIALTHHSQHLLRQLGVWEHIPPEAPSALREARVLNGSSPYALRFDVQDRPEAALGQLVSNHLIRRALFRSLAGQEGCTLLTGAEVVSAATEGETGRVTLSDGRVLRARLVVGADTRFSAMRRFHGIAADAHDFGRSMLVGRLSHEAEHEHIATEWFDEAQTIAMLPLNGRVSSLVLTLPAPEIERLATAPADAFGEEITRRYRARLGRMRLIGARHVYPLATSYARRFVASRFALIGDAAVGMHPVTAHGFNLGLRGADTLAQAIRAALRAGRDVADPRALHRYESAHRRATWPIYTGTNLVARLYSESSLPARVARHAALRLGNHFTPFKHAVRAMLMESEAPVRGGNAG